MFIAGFRELRVNGGKSAFITRKRKRERDCGEDKTV